ncbi:MAG: flippase-like domain-containing protein [Desulfamplus sp.]|nr:flippase-like domain-containing protein [Desulfamplus sp.]
MSNKIIKLSISLTILSIIFWYIGFNNIVAKIGNMNISAFLFINVITLFGFLSGGAGVILLGKNINPNLSWKDGMKGFLSASSLALFFPGRVGDATLLFFWKSYLEYGSCMAIVMIDKLVTLLVVIIFGSLGLGVTFNLAVGVIAFLSLFLPGLISLILIGLPITRTFIAQKMPKRIKPFFEGLVTTIKYLAKQGHRTLLTLLILTVFRVMAYGIGFWVSIWGVGLTVPFFYSIFVICIAQLSGLIPITVMGLGSVEGVCIYAFAQIGIQEASAITAALLIGRGINILWLAVFFLVFSVARIPHQKIH